MHIGVAATPDVAIPTLDWLLQSDHTIDLVITQPDRPAGRGRQLTQSSVGEWAHQHSINLVKPEKSSELAGKIDDLDLVLTIGYGVLLPENILALPKHGFLNLHFSLLPAYRGAAPAQRALHNGETTTGVTVFKLDKGMDTGPIYSQKSIAIDPAWRSFELLRELSQLGPAVVAEAIIQIEKGVEPIAQGGDASTAPKITKAEAKIDFNSNATSIVNAIKAFTYEPGAWTIWKDEPFKVTAAVVSTHTGFKPGEILNKDDALLVGTKDFCIEILTVTPAGKKEMKAIDWVRGARLVGGEYFG
jgi:methionyl-tRNA formyltransferase